MFKHAKLKSALVMLLATIFTFLVFMPAAEAAGKPAGKNAAPVITQGSRTSLTVNINTMGTFNLNATDSNGDSLLTWGVLTPGTNGTAQVSNPSNTAGKSAVTVSYTPHSDFIGTDNFTVSVTDSKGATDSIIIDVTILSTTPPPTPATINYVALGDSIATGTIYSGNKITSYVSYFYNYIKQQNQGKTIIMNNLAHDGDRSSELNSKLSSDTTMINAVKSANIITISIGGNNLMQAAKDNTSLSGYNFNKIDTTVAEQGRVAFKNDWPQIVSKIKTLNPNAQIIVNTVYNPYNESDTLHRTVDQYLSRTDGFGINDLINNNATLDYQVADVFTAFDEYKTNMGEITYFYPKDLWGAITRNPHPNATGQGIITKLHEALYKPITQ